VSTIRRLFRAVLDTSKCEFPTNASFLDDLADKVRGSKAIIADLRGCPANAVETLESFAGRFVSESTVLHKMVERKNTEGSLGQGEKANFLGTAFLRIDSQRRSKHSLHSFNGRTQRWRWAMRSSDGP
jgi:hypothetical protein